MKKLLSLVLCLIMMVGLVACNQSNNTPANNEPEEVTITFYCNPSKNGGVEAAVAAFEAANPNIHVEIVEFPSDTNQKKTTLSSIFQAQDDSADVFMMDCTWPDEFISAGWLLPLDGLYTDEELKEFIPGIMDICFDSNGTMYAIPEYLNAGVLVYRDDLLKKYNYEPAKTWEELIEQCKVIMQGEAAEGNPISGFTSAWMEYEGLTCCIFEFMWDYGAKFAANGNCTLDSKEAQEGLNVMRRMVEEGITDPGIRGYKWADSQAIFNAGSAIYMRDWPSAYKNAINPEKSSVSDSVGVTVLPSGPAGSFTTNGGWYIAVNAFTSQPEAAKQFAKFICGYEGQVAYSTLSGDLPTRPATYSDKAFEGSLVPQLAEIALTTTSRPSSAYYSEISAEIYTNGALVIDGTKTAEEATKDMTTNIQAILGR